MKKPYKVINGDMLKVLPTLEENSFDSCITDPPYELTPEYIPIIEARCDYALNKFEYDLAKEKVENEKKGIMDLFDFVEE